MESYIAPVVIYITGGQGFPLYQGAFHCIGTVGRPESGDVLKESSTRILLFAGDEGEHGPGFLFGLITALFLPSAIMPVERVRTNL
jgi:hypothetical protein